MSQSIFSSTAKHVNRLIALARRPQPDNGYGDCDFYLRLLTDDSDQTHLMITNTMLMSFEFLHFIVSPNQGLRHYSDTGLSPQKVAEAAEYIADFCTKSAAIDARLVAKLEDALNVPVRCTDGDERMLVQIEEKLLYYKVQISGGSWMQLSGTRRWEAEPLFIGGVILEKEGK